MVAVSGDGRGSYLDFGVSDVSVVDVDRKSRVQQHRHLVHDVKEFKVSLPTLCLHSLWDLDWLY